MVDKVEWTDAKIRDLTDMLAKGMRPKEIAQRMSSKYRRNFTKNSIIGKVHRLGLSLTPDTANQQDALRRTISRRQSKDASSETTFPPIESVGARGARTLAKQQLTKVSTERKTPPPQKPVLFIERHYNQCAYPLWDDDEPVHKKRVCGNPVEAGTSWCYEHLRLVSQ